MRIKKNGMEKQNTEDRENIIKKIALTFMFSRPGPTLFALRTTSAIQKQMK